MRRQTILAGILLVAVTLGCDGGIRPVLSPSSPTAPVPTVPPDCVDAQVVDVIDGDTIRVEVGGEVYPVRYIGIDTPEVRRSGLPAEWMAQEATEANRHLVAGGTVCLEKDVSETDRFGRLLRYVFLPDGTFVNAELVRLGYAQVFSYPPDVRYQGLLLEMLREAREAGRGLWGPAPAGCDCSGGPNICSGFETRAEAQACYEYCALVGAHDLSGLDEDHDGWACEHLP